MRTRLFTSLALVLALAAGTSFAGSGKMSYIYKRGDRSYIRIDGDLRNIRALSNKYGSEFVWISTNGREYLIRDAATLNTIRSIFRDADALHPSVQAVEKKMRPYERRLQELENQLDKLSDSLDDDDLTDRTRASVEEKMHVIERAMQDVELEMGDVEEEMERISDKMERLEEIAEANFEKLVERAIANGIAERVD